MLTYAVIDTNVLVSALLTRDTSSPTVLTFRKVFTGELIPVLTDQIIAEYRTVLMRPKFRFDPEDVDGLLVAITALGLRVSPSSSGITLKDPADSPFYDALFSVEMHPCYLITGNLRHFPNEPRILSPRKFIEVTNELP